MPKHVDVTVKLISSERVVVYEGTTRLRVGRTLEQAAKDIEKQAQHATEIPLALNRLDTVVVNGQEIDFYTAKSTRIDVDTHSVEVFATVNRPITIIRRETKEKVKGKIRIGSSRNILEEDISKSLGEPVRVVGTNQGKKPPKVMGLAVSILIIESAEKTSVAILD